MEIRAGYVAVGTLVLALLSGLAAFSVWLVRADGDDRYERYEIAFTGAVSGLQEGGQVLYRGIRVGVVDDIRIDPDNVELVLVVIDVEEGTPVRADTVASLELQGVTGLAYVQLQGGTQASPPLLSEDDRLPRIASRRSALERVFESTPELLMRAVAVVDRLDTLLTEDNLEAFGQVITNLATVTGTLAARADSIDAIVVGTENAVGRVDELTAEFKQLSGDLRTLTGDIGQQVAAVGGDLTGVLAELEGAATPLAQAAQRFDRMLADLNEPVDDFAGSGLYEFTQLIGETRLLVAALSRITKEFERDPAGFLIGRGSTGFVPE